MATLGLRLRHAGKRSLPVDLEPLQVTSTLSSPLPRHACQLAPAKIRALPVSLSSFGKVSILYCKRLALTVHTSVVLYGGRPL